MPHAGTTIGDYQLVQWLARGGSADVYAATHPLIRRPLALKLAHRHDDHVGARFARELQILSQLDIDGIARAYDFGRTEDGRVWLVLDRIDGLGPRDWAAAVGAPGSPRRQQKIATLGAKLARALAALHAHGLVHGDVKPQNLRVAIGGRPTLFDLGAALDLQAPISWTRFGAGLGTSRYAPPEVIRRELTRIGPGADLFALGATLTELLGHADGPLAELLAELSHEDPDARPNALTTATRLAALGEPIAAFAPLTPRLAVYRDTIDLGRGFLEDAPPGRGLLIEGPRGSGVAEVLARLAEDAIALGAEIVAYERVGLDGAIALSKAHLDRAHVLVVTELGALDTDTRRALEAALGEAAGRWAPLLLLAGRETRVETPGPTVLGRKLQLLTAHLHVTTTDYTHAVGDALRGLVWSAAFGPRWSNATAPKPVPNLGVNAALLLATLRAVAWPIPRAALTAATHLGSLAFVDALRELSENDLIEAADGQLRAVGAVTAEVGPAIDWAAGDAFVEGHARIAWLVASHRLDDAQALLATFVPPDDDASALDDARLLELLAPRLSHPTTTALYAAWRDALEPHGPLGSHGAEAIWALRAQGRLSEAKALATRTLSRSHRVATKVAAALALAQLCDDLGTTSLARYYRGVAHDEAERVGARVSAPRRSDLPDELAHAARHDARRAGEILERIVRHLDDHDRSTLGLRPEIVSLRVSNP